MGVLREKRNLKIPGHNDQPSAVQPDPNRPVQKGAVQFEVGLSSNAQAFKSPVEFGNVSLWVGKAEEFFKKITKP